MNVSHGLVSNIFPTYSQGTIPTSRAKGHTIRADTQAADTVFVASEHPYTFSLERIPNIARPVVVSTEQNASGNGEGDRGDTTKNVVVCESI